MRWRRAAAVVALVTLAGAVSACGAASTDPTTTTAAPAAARTWSIVALGDSVPAGANCSCKPYPPLTATGLTTSSHQTVTATNDSVSGTSTGGVLKQVESDKAVMDHVRKADAVEIEVGANDVGYSSKCGTKASCYAPKLPTIEKNLAAIVGRVHKLRGGHKTLVVLLDYWSVWLGGKYAAAKGQAYVDAAAHVTDDVDDAIKATAAKTGAAYVDLRAAFKGPNYAYDETHYLSNDGDHPNAAGHQQIATATEAVIQNALHI